ncbi:hypothetical protein BV25DRAFT_1813747, partial [Artomyces pyxidatus]
MPSSRRFFHETDNSRLERERELWEQGQQQAKLSNERYHYLCAAIQEAYTFNIVPRDANNYPRPGLIFSSYTAYDLEPVRGLNFHPQYDTPFDPEDIRYYVSQFRRNWKCREGGILYCLAEGRRWWKMLFNYHSSAATTGHKVWDRLFAELKNNNFDKRSIRCMFFARESGCLDPNCPFLHDEEQCRKDRQAVLRDRRYSITRIPIREVSMRQAEQMNAYNAKYPDRTLDDIEDDDPELTAINLEPFKIDAICWNPACLRVRFKEPYEHESEVSKISRCKRCTIASYCSVKCQTADWPRHKRDPCAPMEEIIENDDLW